MNNSALRYIAKTGDYITNWLVSDVVSVPFAAEQVPIDFSDYKPGAGYKTPEGEEQTSPAKLEFLEKANFKSVEYPYHISIDKFYHPFDTTRVDFTDFWSFPEEITFYAKIYIDCMCDCEQPFEISTGGAVRVWVDKSLQAEFYPYNEVNIEQRSSIVLNLCKGLNEVLVACNDYGERNIVFKFGLKNLGSPLNICLPISADVEKIKRIHASLNAMYIEKLSYQSGNINMITEIPFEDNCTVTAQICGIEKQFSILPGDNRILWGDAAELPIGYHSLTVSSWVDAVDVSADLWLEVYPKHMEIPALQTYGDRAKAALDFIINNTETSYEQFIAHLARGENRFEEYKQVITQIISHINRRGDCADFRVVKTLWIIKKYAGLLTGEQLSFFMQAVLNFRYWFDEKGNDAMWFFSENHALCFHTGEMIAGELFPDTVFPNSGLTGTEHTAKAKKLLLEWFDKLFEFGYNEWNSAAYISVDMLAFISLYEMCEDEEIRSLAKRALDFTYGLFARNSFKGVLGTSNGRTYRRDLLANLNFGTNPLIWLAWGLSNMNSHISPAVFFAISSYQADENLKQVALWDTNKKFVAQEAQGSFKVKTVLCKTKDYILGSCISPLTGKSGSQEHLLNIFLSDPNCRIWINHPGEGKIFGERRPGYFTGNGLTPLVLQQYNTAIMNYCFSDEATALCEVQFTHAFCDTDVCDEVSVGGNWIFIKRKTAYAALYSSNAISISRKPPLNGKEFISKGINSLWFIKVSSESEIGSFESFTRYMKDHPPLKKQSLICYHDYEYGEIEFKLQ